MPEIRGIYVHIIERAIVSRSKSLRTLINDQVETFEEKLDSLEAPDNWVGKQLET